MRTRTLAPALALALAVCTLGWSSLVRRLDSWVTDAACFNKFTTFSHGISHYFYTKPTTKRTARGAGADAMASGAGGVGSGQPTSKVQFGKVASKQVYRDIFRSSNSHYHYPNQLPHIYTSTTTSPALALALLILHPSTNLYCQVLARDDGRLAPRR